MSRPTPATLVLVLAGAALLGACGGSDDLIGPTCTVSAVTLAPAEGTLRVGGTMSLVAAVSQTGCSESNPTWSSSNADVLRVSSDGTLTAVAPGGPVTISARVRDVVGTGAYVVIAPVASVALAPVGPLTLAIGQSQRFTATPRDAAGGPLAGRSVTWSSSNAPSVAIGTDGVATAIAAGQATISATVEGRTATVVVSVTSPVTPPPPPPAPVATVTVAPATLALTVGETGTLTATARDASGAALTGRPITWASSNPAVATVSTSGLVTAVAAGQAGISASAEGRTGTTTVTVTAPVPPPPRPVTLTIRNDLLYPVNIAVGGSTIGSVSAQSTQSATVTASASMRVSFTLVQPTAGGRALGDPLSGYWDLTNPSGTVSLTVDNVVGGVWYFAPVVTNTSGTTLLMAVNWGLSSENRCNCTVPPNGIPTALGYYRLFGNSTLAAFRDGSNYTGAYRIVSNFGNGVPRGSGRVPFTFSVAP